MTRLADEQICWLSTVRPDGRPHLTPIWYVWLDDRFWICTGSAAVKARNIAANSAVSVSLQSGTEPLIAEGIADLHHRPFPDPVVDAFLATFDWNIALTNDPAEVYDALIEIRVVRWLMGNPAR